ncbi:Transposase and inactivated derivatives, IS30 family [Kurthia zopfii]|nr:Transposase and inactivated derivatives, IS30 family [Kurthia zopfii]
MASSSQKAVQEKLGKTWSPEQIVGRFNIGTPISKRPLEVRKRETFGHWELDTVVSGRGKEFSCYKVLEQDINIQVYFADAYSS